MGLLDQISFTIASEQTGPRHAARRATQAAQKKGGGSEDEVTADQLRSLTTSTHADRKRLQKEQANKSFEKLQHQFQHRHRAHQEKVKRDIAKIDVNLFTDDVATGSSGAQFHATINGALPPTTPERNPRDIEKWRAIKHSEREAANTLIDRRREADRNELYERAAETKAGKRPRAAPRPEITLAEEDEDGLEFLPGASPDDDEEVGVTASRSYKPVNTNDWKDFENRVTVFHQRSELEKMSMKSSITKASFMAQMQEQEDYVHRYHLEEAHRKAETRILKASKHYRANLAYRQYRDDMEEKLFIRWKEDLADKMDLQKEVKAKRAVKAARATLREAEGGFGARCFIVDTTCKAVDRQELRAQRLRQRKEHVAATKANWALRSRQLAARHDLIQAQTARQDAQARMHLKYLLQRERKRIDSEAAGRHEKILAERQFKAFMRQLALQLLQQESPPRAADDLAAYEHMLSVLKELAKNVREHSINIATGTAGDDETVEEDLIPEKVEEVELPDWLTHDGLAKALEPVEQQVRSALSTAATTMGNLSDPPSSRGWDGTAPWSPRFGAGVGASDEELEQDPFVAGTVLLEMPPSPSNATQRVGQPHGIVLEEVEPPPTLESVDADHFKARAGAAADSSPMSLQKMGTLLLQAPSASNTLPASARARNEMRSLGALRRHRQGL